MSRALDSLPHPFRETGMLRRLTAVAVLVLSIASAAQSQTERRTGASECQAAGTSVLQGQPLTDAEARAVVGPWYSLFTIPGRRDVRAVFEEVIAPDFVGCTGDRPGD